jgi:hypothetical protein
MKQGKKPTKRHIIAMVKTGLNPDHWLVTKSLPNEVCLVHRESGAERVIPA